MQTDSTMKTKTAAAQKQSSPIRPALCLAAGMGALYASIYLICRGNKARALLASQCVGPLLVAALAGEIKKHVRPGARKERKED